MTTFAEFIIDLEDERDRWKRDCQLCQKHRDELRERRECDAKQWALTEFEMTNDINGLKRRLRMQQDLYLQMATTFDAELKRSKFLNEQVIKLTREKTKLTEALALCDENTNETGTQACKTRVSE